MKMDELKTETSPESYYLLDESDDDWYYTSIPRFDQLQMFNFETPAHHLDFSENDRICCTSKIRNRKQEIQEFILPEKDPASAFESHDLKLKTGGFSSNPVYQMKCLKGLRRLVLSEEDTTGASVYELGYDHSDLIQRISAVNCSVKRPQLSVHGNKLALGSSSQNIHLADLDTCKALKYPVNENSGEDILGLSFLDSQSIAYCEPHLGQVRLLDFRSDNEKICALSISTCCQTDNSVAKVWHSFAVHCNLKFFGLISSQGDISVYDFRCVRQYPLFETKMKTEDSIPVENFTQIMFSPHDMFSVSSNNGTVEVFSLKTGKMKCIFSYDGHNRHKLNNKVFILNHIWSPVEGNLIYSSGTDGSFHCWKFIEH